MKDSVRACILEGQVDKNSPRMMVRGLMLRVRKCPAESCSAYGAN